ncbi:hypothetical protein L7F22_046863 [Adiantum nelumboides]|nr:hypothetical protein [Adiantum nelumboides]
MHSMQEFWEFCVTQHSKPLTRWWHIAGTAFALLLILAASVSATWWLALIEIALGYSLALYSHFVIEGNTPVSFGHPSGPSSVTGACLHSCYLAAWMPKSNESRNSSN